jgi:hypothetical protein
VLSPTFVRGPDCLLVRSVEHLPESIETRVPTGAVAGCLVRRVEQHRETEIGVLASSGGR